MSRDEHRDAGARGARARVCWGWSGAESARGCARDTAEIAPDPEGVRSAESAMGENAKAAPCVGSSTAKSIAVREGRTDVDAADEEPICHVDACGHVDGVRRAAEGATSVCSASRPASRHNLAPVR